ncbi:MAG: hypothetical protein ACOX22_06185 [Caldicoprobacterales bacterium]|jgi:uncharacterized integral membrane protein|nr:hypothetical protein [Clostridiales bacterium]
MSDNDIEQCRHTYIVGYSFRMPQPFFRSLLCDKCSRRIKLSLHWRILFWFVDIIGFVFAFGAATSVQIKLFGSTFLVQLFVFLLLAWMVQLIARLILRYGKWVEADKK